MSSNEADATHRLLLKRYQEKGFLRPETALDSNIRDLMQKGRTWEAAVRELHSSDSPWVYSPIEPLRNVSEEKMTEEDVAAAEQVVRLREKIDSLTTLFSKGEITEETYLRGVKNIEDSIGKLQREHKIPKVQRRENSIPIGFSGYSRQEVNEDIGESYHYRGSPSNAWYLVPLLFGILGGIVGYAAVKSEDAELADNLLTFGIIWTVVVGFLLWFLMLF